jgi:hypothetical protein
MPAAAGLGRNEGSGMIVDDLRRIPMSARLVATLARAAEYARAQSLGEVALEHLLLALTEDADAGQVLAASHVDLALLKADVSQYLGGLEAPTDGPTESLGIAGDMRRILEAAAVAASQGRRRDINGAIVLAAIVGDGKSSAAHMLRAQGLTFEEAIKALQRAMTAPSPPAPPSSTPAPATTAPLSPSPPAAAPPPPPLQVVPPPPPSADAEDALAAARGRTQPRVIPGLPPFASAPDSAAPSPAERAVPDLPPPPLPTSMAPPPDLPPLPTGPIATARPEPPAVRDDDLPTARRRAGVTSLDAFRAAITAELAAVERATAAVEPPPPAPPPVPPAPPVATVVPPPAPPAPPTAAVPDPPERREPPWAAYQGEPPPPPRRPVAVDRPPAAGPRAIVTPLPPPASRARPSVPPAGDRWPPPIGPAEPPPSIPAAPSEPPPPAPTLAEPPPWSPPAPPLQPPMPPARPSPGEPWADAPPPAPPTYPGTYAPGAFAAPDGIARLQAPPRRRMPIDNAVAGQLVDRVPRRMTVGVTTMVEVRLGRAGSRTLLEGIDGEAGQHRVLAAPALSMRLRGKDGAFVVDPLSPETQWLESRPGLDDRELATWRWRVTPTRSGTGQVQLIVSARTGRTDGAFVDTAMPDQVVEIGVGPNVPRLLARVGAGVAILLVGAVIGLLAQPALQPLFDALVRLMR